MNDAAYVRPAAASAQFSVSARTLSRWARRGCISVSKPSPGVTLYRLTEIQQWIDVQTTPRAVVQKATEAPTPSGGWATPFWEEALAEQASRERAIG